MANNRFTNEVYKDIDNPAIRGFKQAQAQYVQVGKPQKGIKSKTTFAGTKRARKMGKDREIEVCLEQAYECGRLGHDKLHIKSMKYRLHLAQPSKRECNCNPSTTLSGQSAHQMWCYSLPQPSPKCCKGQELGGEFHSGNCSHALNPVNYTTTTYGKPIEEAKTWEDRFDKEIWSVKSADFMIRVKQFISEEISKAREEEYIKIISSPKTLIGKEIEAQALTEFKQQLIKKVKGYKETLEQEKQILLNNQIYDTQNVNHAIGATRNILDIIEKS